MEITEGKFRYKLDKVLRVLEFDRPPIPVRQVADVLGLVCMERKNMVEVLYVQGKQIEISIQFRVT